MDPLDARLATACGDHDVGREKARGDADAQNKECTSQAAAWSIEP
jgi:hypothetical protein